MRINGGSQFLFWGQNLVFPARLYFLCCVSLGHLMVRDNPSVLHCWEIPGLLLYKLTQVLEAMWPNARAALLGFICFVKLCRRVLGISAWHSFHCAMRTSLAPFLLLAGPGNESVFLFLRSVLTSCWRPLPSSCVVWSLLRKTAIILCTLLSHTFKNGADI